MKHIGSFFFILLVTGCATSNRTTEVIYPTPHYYPENELALHLAQDSSSGELTLTLNNTSSYPITNQFPKAVFEGTIWIVQEGSAPLKTYPSNFFNLSIRALWWNPPITIPPGEKLTYAIALDLLLCPFSLRQPDPRQPVFAFASLDKFELASNTIRLEKHEKIKWRAGVSQFTKCETRKLSAVLSGH
jgi:hypothetical protein